MNDKNIYQAVEYVGHDLIYEAETTHFTRPCWKTLLPTAAIFVLLLGLGPKLFSSVQSAETIDPKATTVSTNPSPTTEPVTTEKIKSVHPLVEQFSLLDETTLLDIPDQDWSNFYLNEAGLDDNGTDIYTTLGDQVLAVDAKNSILLIRIHGEDYQGILAWVRNPIKLSVQVSSQYERTGEGEPIGKIADAHNGVLAANASHLGDVDQNGYQFEQFAICDGVTYNEDTLIDDSQARLEINSSGEFSIASPAGPLGKDVKNAVQFAPALIIDGEISNSLEDWSGKHPRSCIGQTKDGNILILVIEGRLPERSLGTSLGECADIFLRYGAEQAMTLDYGTSAILWYDGEYVTMCSNRALPEGRSLPNAFVVERTD